MNVNVIGGGPAGLYFAIQLKKARPDCNIDIFERNPKGSTFGWGVVFSDETLDNFLSADPPTHQAIRDSLYHWDDIEVHFKGARILSSGHGFSGVGRHRLLEILSQRAEDLSVNLNYGSLIEDVALLRNVDLLVAADGIFSQTRERFCEHFLPDIDWRNCRYIWLGTKRPFPAFTFFFKETEFGWFQAHCYQFNSDTSTFIVECHESTWQAAGIDKMSKDESIRFCESLFEEELAGHELISNSAHLRGSAAWITFPRVNCRHWSFENMVLLGDSAATAHFSIGSGTKLAMESAICLADVVTHSNDMPAALKSYEDERRLEVLKLQNAARNSMEWFEQVDLKAKLEPVQFTYSLLTRSQRVSHENLRLRDSKHLEGVERWFQKQATGEERPIPPMFAPLKLRDVELSNRVAVSPMAMYSATDGSPTDFHLVHLGARALGGAGLVFTEMTCISPQARITPGCTGLYHDEHTAAWQRIVSFVHNNTPAKIAMQLGHAGRKGSTKLGWEGMDEPLDTGNWELLAPSPIPYTENNQVPREMTREDMDQVTEDFVSATKRAAVAGFDLLELHCAHGYLLSTFISPLTNKRSDEYGGSLENRLRFPTEVFAAMRAVWPPELPMSGRISATDWHESGIDADEAVDIAKAFSAVGADIIDVSAGQVVADQKPVYGRMFQTPFAERIRAETGLQVMAVGNIYEPDHVNGILAAGRADLCLLARPHLSDSQWMLHAAAELGVEEQWWPKQYLSGKDQLYRLAAKAKAE